ncbi:MAG: glycosyltransferase family 4 protein [Promethearchaeota archaeon]
MEFAGKKKKHILIIVENSPVPFDRRVWLEAKALFDNNYDVSVVCPKGINNNDNYEYKEGIHIYRHPVPKEKEKITSYLGEYLVALFWEFFLSFKLFIRKRFDVIHACNPPDNIFLVALFYKIFGVKFIFDHHDLSPEQYIAKFGKKDFFYMALKIFEKMTFKLADVSIATNNSYKEIAVQRGGMNPEKVFIVRNGPELDKLKKMPAKKSLKHGKRYLIGYVGTMGKQEGLNYLIKVIKFIVREKGRKDIHFTCVGGGPALNYLKLLSKNMNLTDYVNFTGRIPDEELFEILNASDVCVNPDIPNDFNNKSTMIKIMEYMALKKPIVQFDLKEGKLSAGKASLYAKKNNIRDFGEKILILVENKDLRKKMGEIGYKRVQYKLDWKYSIPNLLKVYRVVFQ